MIHPEILDGFLDEANSYLPTIREGIAAFQQAPKKGDLLEDAHRCVHTIKGASAMVGLSGLSHIAYHFEETLEALAAGQIESNAQSKEFLRRTLDIIGTYLDAVKNDTLHEEPLLQEVKERYGRLFDLPPAANGAEMVEVNEENVHQPTPASDQTGDLNDDYDWAEELRETFMLEAEDHLGQISRGFATLTKSPHDRDEWQVVRRAVHTLKGASATMGETAVAALAHRMEDALDLIYNGSLTPTVSIVETLQAAGDVLAMQLVGEVDERVVEEIMAGLAGVVGERKSSRMGEGGIVELPAFPSSVPTTKQPVNQSPNQPTHQPSPATYVRVPLEKLDELVRLVSELVITRTGFEQQMTTFRELLAEFEPSMGRLRGLAQKLDTRISVSALHSNDDYLARQLGGFLPDNEFDALEFDRYSEIHLLARELAETSSDIRTVGHELGYLAGDFEGILATQKRLSSELQDKLLRTRMIPLQTISARLHRAVRLVAKQRGKQVELTVSGEAIELDKKMLEAMADPLLHLVRNAVDHGIEPPALRQVLGKPEQGNIQLQAYHEGSQVVLQIRDDGAGLDPQAIRAKGIERGIVTEANAHRLEGSDLYDLIFLPGFSTASEISDVSGRGVGLDVVKESVAAMKGTLSVTSEVGQGTCFTVRLPMTLAVTQALMVLSGGQRYAIPLSDVTQILRLEADEMELVGETEVVRIGGVVYPVKWLSEALGMVDPGNKSDQDTPYHHLLLLNLGENSVALVVDRILEGREIVVKPLGTHLRRVAGIAGATLMGDGEVVLILHVAELLTDQAIRQPAFDAPRQPSQSSQNWDIMVVDDSVSVRRVVSKLVTNAGWTPHPAKDGQDALEQMQTMKTLPTAILLDVEMPRMNGYELTTTLRANPATAHIPIVMLTSRAGDKHREKAMSLGASAYLVKPYQEEELIDTVKRLVTKNGHFAEKITIHA